MQEGGELMNLKVVGQDGSEVYFERPLLSPHVHAQAVPDSHGSWFRWDMRSKSSVQSQEC